ncbi:hypothetical protein LPJ66_000273 [Kickxella alabastrina]|uniref:Uncharacterized protein n=1 Tax=Kickxella alabastrina TaxID=61397 RepID=A0ACC1IWK0_9FUNG|nr:hypothetical protein LPJ66_000273 [Kickxella alabastrina]
MRYSIYSIIGLVAMGVTMAEPDVAGTRTVFISLATGDQGELIPLILHKNSDGFEPASLPSSSSSEIATSESIIVESASESESAEADGSDSSSSEEEVDSNEVESEDISAESHLSIDASLETPFPAENTNMSQQEQPSSEESSTSEESVDPESSSAVDESAALESSADKAADAGSAEETAEKNSKEIDSDSDSENDEDNSEVSAGAINAEESKTSMAPASAHKLPSIMFLAIPAYIFAVAANKRLTHY